MKFVSTLIGTALIGVLALCGCGGSSSSPTPMEPPPPSTSTPNEFLYVSNGTFYPLTLNTVSAYKVDTTTGTLSPVSGSPFAADFSGDIVAHPNGKFLFVGRASYAVDPNTGTIAKVGSCQSNIKSLALDSTGTFLFGVPDIIPDPRFADNARISVCAVDSTSGALTTAAGLLIGPVPLGLAAHPTAGVLYLHESGILFSFSTDGGSLTFLSLLDLPGQDFCSFFPGNFCPDLSPRNMALDPSGNFLVTAYGALNVFKVEAATGALSIQQTMTPGNWMTIAIAPSGRFAFATVTASPGFTGSYPAIDAFQIDSSGQLTRVANAPFTGEYSYSVVVDPSGKFLYATNPQSNQVAAYAINQSTGALTPVPGSPFPSGINPIGIAVLQTQ